MVLKMGALLESLLRRAGLQTPIEQDIPDVAELADVAPRMAEYLAKATHANEAYPYFAQHGFHLLRKHYYLPIPEPEDLKEPFAAQPSELVGVDMNPQGALTFLRSVVAPVMNDFRKLFPLKSTGDPSAFHLINGSYMAVDAHVYHALIRHYRPKRIIEIGGGASTLLAATTSIQCLHEDARPKITAIEPYPSAFLAQGFPGLTELIPKRLQETPMELFTSLEANDILFIDSTHVLRPGGDVHLEYLEILPRLRPGVLVHVHDVCLPMPYPSVYAGYHWYWNEQYLLQAFLAYNSRFEVLWPGAYMTHHHFTEVTKVIPELNDMRAVYPQSDASAFWMRVRGS